MKKLRNLVCVTVVVGLTGVFAPGAFATGEVPPPPPDNGSNCNAGRGNLSEGCDPGRSSTSPGGGTGQNQGGDEGGPIRGGTGAP